MVNLFQKPRLSKVNARHLLDDLAGSYSHGIEETVLVELIANALDAAADRIDFQVDADNRRFSVKDNGIGMTQEEFVRYHDLAESRKQWGSSFDAK